MRRYWFGDIEGGACSGAVRDTAALVERYLALTEEGGQAARALGPDVEEAVRCGCFADRDQYVAILREMTIALAEEEIRKCFGKGDVELAQMVRLLDELDEVINLLTEKSTEWYLVKNPAFSRKYRSCNAKKMVGIMKRDRTSLGRVAGEVDRLSATRSTLTKEISHRADILLPNCSALVGGLVAARILARAGGLSSLASFPSSTIQVLGAENALFTHLRAGSPSPKHGIIFQHRRVHNAPKQIRGRVARVLAGKLAIAARIDAYRGEADEAFLEKAQAAIDRAGETA
ncbi:MAG TPA: RNA-processing protein [Methanoculleus sp.]|nr:RNA-processing protein [Methanoculleus sp.]